MVPPVPLSASSPPFISTSPQPVVHLRIDRPELVARPTAIMRRWGAEEFSGELDDRINPSWLFSRIEATANSSIVVSSALEMRAGTVAPAPASRRGLRLFTSEPPPIVVEQASADEASDL